MKSTEGFRTEKSKRSRSNAELPPFVSTTRNYSEKKIPANKLKRQKKTTREREGEEERATLYGTEMDDAISCRRRGEKSRKKTTEKKTGRKGGGV